MAPTPPLGDFGAPAPAFTLKATDGKTYGLDDVKGAKGTVIVFICNHCPYVKSIVGRLVETAKTLQAEGVGFAAICSNDAVNHPDDGFAKMRLFAETNGFSFPYLHDESQDVARSYGAVCTPDFFGYDADLTLQYRGRLDESKTTLVPGAANELLAAMRQVAATGKGPATQTPSMGCSIKWKAA
ncbi:MAG: thioredoxin family protein [Geminicoccaceae bacterium]|nr:MAG: thioredoxin family protein [Geminicoccaceae bacterium]